MTYTDGEDSDAGVGVAAWCSELFDDVPIAGFLEVPREVRQPWPKQKEHARYHATSDEEFQDIIEIEAIGPLVMLYSWPCVFRDALWLHFVDNKSA